jgi:hypothetical protein
VVDFSWKILTEYRKNIREGGLAQQYLNQLLTQPINRLIFVKLDFDADGYAIVPSDLMIDDEEDRKFIAAALAHTPTPPIIDATDTDWEKEKARLQKHGINVQELCPEYIQEKMK